MHPRVIGARRALGRRRRRAGRCLRGELRLLGLAAWRALVQLLNGHDFTFAASIAYYALLSFFPFLLLVISLLGSLTAGEEARLAVFAFILRYFPTQFDFITTQLDAFRQLRVQAGLGGLLALVWASLGFFGSLSSAVNHAWRVEKQRSFLKHRLVAFLMLLSAGGVLVVGVALWSAMQVAEASWFGVWLSRFPGLTAFTGWGIHYATSILFVVAVGLLFYFIPNTAVRFRDVWVGAVITGLLWRGALFVFTAYIGGSSPRLTMIHGSIAAVISFLVWVYVSAVILMYGVEFTASYGRLRRHRIGHAETSRQEG